MSELRAIVLYYSIEFITFNSWSAADKFLQMNAARFPNVMCVLCGGEVLKSSSPGSGELGPCPAWQAKYRAGEFASLHLSLPLQHPQFDVHSTLTRVPNES